MGNGGYWSTYWYNGVIVGSEISRGLDIFELTPSGFISKDEIEASKTVHLDHLNVQGQTKFVWPPSFSLARAYLDQLERSKGLEEGRISEVRKSLASAEKMSGKARQDALTSLASQIEAYSAAAPDAAKVKTLSGAVKDLAGAPDHLAATN